VYKLCIQVNVLYCWQFSWQTAQYSTSCLVCVSSWYSHISEYDIFTNV